MESPGIHTPAAAVVDKEGHYIGDLVGVEVKKQQHFRQDKVLKLSSILKITLDFD